MKEYFKVVLNHLEKLKKANKEINSKNLLCNFNVRDFETIKVLDTFILEKGLYD